MGGDDKQVMWPYNQFFECYSWLNTSCHSSANSGVLIASPMALLRYFKTKDGLPDPRGVLSSLISSAIAQANSEVQKAISSTTTKQKRGAYKMYSSSHECKPRIHECTSHPQTQHALSHSYAILYTCQFPRKNIFVGTLKTRKKLTRNNLTRKFCDTKISRSTVCARKWN